MNTTRWISDKVSKLLPHASAKNGSNGYSTGNSQEEFPKLKVFATLSPIPGFRAWLGKNAADKAQELDAKSPVRKMPVYWLFPPP